jgi:MFS family permease
LRYNIAMSAAEDSPPKHDPYAALRQPSVCLYLGGNFIASVGFLMKDAAIMWEVFARTGSFAALGMVGLVQSLPVLALPLLTGHVADKYDRRTIMHVSLLLLSVNAVVLAVNSFLQGPLWVLFAALGAHGVVRAFQQPARQSLLPLISTPAAFPNAVTWGSGAFHLAQVIGPLAAGGILFFTRQPWIVYAIYAVLVLVFFVLLFSVKYRKAERNTEVLTLATLTSGLRFVITNHLLLAVMTIDLLAVLFGGATGLMPAVQSVVLEVSDFWYGVLRATPAMGSVVVSLWIAHRPPFARAGRAMLLAVAGYGVATMLFGLSSNLWLTLSLLFVLGACDIVSVVIRHTLLQTLTPDHLRGRVSAINGMFIGASNYLGDAEAGYVAYMAERWTGDAIFGTRFSIVTGGLAAIGVTALAAAMVPQLRSYGKISDSTPVDEEPIREGEELR